jgi:DNA-binding transcriptional MocR family regulator
MSGLAAIRLVHEAPTPLYRQIADQITQAVHEGRISPGERLPPIRRLAELLAVSPITATQAYQTLAQEGVATGQIGRGTFILPIPGRLPAASASQSPLPSVPEPGASSASSSSPVFPAGAPVVPAAGESIAPAEDWMSRLAAAVPQSSQRGQRRSVALGQLFAQLLRNENDPSLIDFSGANPAPELFGLADWHKILAQAGRSLEQEIRNTQDRSAFQYGPSIGDLALRVFLTTYLQRYSLAVTADEILLTSGTQQGLDLVARTFFMPGDSVFVEEHSYIAALDIFEQFDVQLRPIPMDEEGLRLEELERLLGAPQARPRWLYTIPTGQSPTGISLAVERRRRLAEAAHRAHVIIVEDDAFNDLSYEARAERTSPLLMPAVSSFAHGGECIYLKSFSKTTFPGVRMGCLVADPALLSILAEEKGLVDRGASVLVARAVLAYLRSSAYTRHLEDMRTFYVHRRDVLLTALERELGDLGCSWTIPGAGFSLLLSIPAELDEMEVLEEAVANGIVVAPGRFFSAAAPSVSDHRLRLTFGDKSPEQLEEATRRLGLSLRTVLERAGAATAAALPAPSRRMTTDV